MKKVLFFAVLLLIAASSCTKEEPTVVASTNNEVKEMMDILKASGINLSTVNVNQKLQCFIVEGDIAIDFKDIPTIKESLKNRSKSLEKAYKYPNPYYATLPAVSSIDIFIDPSINTSGWQSAVNTAINVWNTVSPNCAVKITTTSNSALADLKISTFYENTGTVALGNGCINGVVGKYININTKYNYLDESTKINTIAHEIGHTIGIAHTNGQSNFCTPILIPETSNYDDPRAVMYPIIHDWYGFSADEVNAVKILYFKNTVIEFNVNVSGPLKAKTGTYCNYTAIVSGGSAVKYEWEAFDSSERGIQVGRNQTFSVKMPANSNLTVRLKVTSSDGKVAISDDWFTLNMDPAVGF